MGVNRFQDYFVLIMVIVSTGTFFSITFSPFVNLLLVLSVFSGVVLRLSKDKPATVSALGGSIVLTLLVFMTFANLFLYFRLGSDEKYSVSFVLFAFKLVLIFFVVDKDKFWPVYCNVVIFISLFSLFLYFLIIFLGFNFLPEWQVGKVKTSYLITVYGNDFVQANLKRNSSIFYEPGVYGAFLTLAFLFEIGKDKVLKKRLVVLAVSALTTMSPVTISLFFVIILYAVLKNSRKIIIWLFFGVPIVFYVIYYLVSFKLESYSFYLRMEDIFLGLEIFYENPVLGVGLFNESSVIDYYYSREGVERGLSNGIVTLLYQGGIIFSVLYLIPMAFSLSGNKLFSFISAFSVIFLILMSQPLQFSNLFIFIYCVGVQRMTYSRAYTSQIK